MEATEAHHQKHALLDKPQEKKDSGFCTPWKAFFQPFPQTVHAIFGLRTEQWL
jgi:hypothetical protein